MPVRCERVLISAGINPKKCPMPSAGSSTRPSLKSEPLDGIVNCGDDCWRSVVRVERGSAGEFVFLGLSSSSLRRFAS